MTYTVIYEKGPTSWGAYVPDLSGVISVGGSRDEVERLIQEAIEFHLEGMREEGSSNPSSIELRRSSRDRPGRLTQNEMQSLNFEGLRAHYPELADLGGFAEQYVAFDPPGALVKLRAFGESLVLAIYAAYRFPRPCEHDLLSLLRTFEFESV